MLPMKAFFFGILDLLMISSLMLSRPSSAVSWSFSLILSVSELFWDDSVASFDKIHEGDKKRDRKMVMIASFFIRLVLF